MEALSIETPSSKKTKVASLKKAQLQENGFTSVKEWLSKPENVYIGRALDFESCIMEKSKWGNPFSTKEYRQGYTPNECIKMYEDYIRNGALYDCLEELDGKTLGCWCYPKFCHGLILIRLLEEKKAKKQKNE